MGPCVGEIVGAGVTRKNWGRVGAGVGVRVGPEVGEMVGSGVGETVGSGVGSGVGWEVGKVVGNKVGWGVGGRVGDRVGKRVTDVEEENTQLEGSASLGGGNSDRSSVSSMSMFSLGISVD